MSAPLVICADDYGISPPTSRAIAELLDRKTINATTCLVETESWPQAAAMLRRLVAEQPGCAVGLHLNLTERFSHCSDPDLVVSLPKLAFRSYLPNPRYEARILAAFAAQWDGFVEAMGHAPHFVDGHRHIHLFPVARRALWKLLREKAFQGWVRQCRTGAKRWDAKVGFLNLLSGDFVAEAALQGVAVNAGFGGIRRFARDEPVLDLWRRDLAAMRSGGLLMVHPGALSTAASDDPLGQLRALESGILQSAAFAGAVRQAGLHLSEDPRHSPF
jgi:predicted glycoside hydrolase/deacetylase ChbG (UPF0249 family)